jgi:hypothetical protein
MVGKALKASLSRVLWRRQSIVLVPEKKAETGGHLRPIGDFDDRHLYVSRDRSRDDQSDHFIEHPRRCGSAPKHRPEPTIKRALL